jgi:type II secretory pathway component HofQ
MNAMKLPAALALVALVAAGSAQAQTTRVMRSTPSGVRPTPTTKKPGHAARAAAAPSRWTGEPVSLDLKDADLRDVLHTFAELTGLNVVVDPEVHGSVTVRLHDVPWDQALDLIVASNGFGYVFEGNVMRVGTVPKLVANP